MTINRSMISVVTPAYNEEGNLEVFYERTRATLEQCDLSWEIIFSIDPSTDRTEEILKSLNKRDPRVKVIRMSRRFGQHMAAIAGMEVSKGDVVVVIDCDLQDPPELIKEMVDKWRMGYDVVYAQRRSRAGEFLTKRLASALFYKVIRRVSDLDIPKNTGDYRLMTRRVVNHLVSLKESHGFWRGLVAFVGFPQIAVEYDREVRMSGSGKYNRYFGSATGAIGAFVGFSRYPLRAVSFLGLVVSAGSFIIAMVYLSLKLDGFAKFPIGNPTIVISVMFLGGVQLLSIGVIGEYVGRIYDEVRERPRYIVESRIGWDADACTQE